MYTNNMSRTENLILKELTGGHSGAQIFKMSFAGQDYCLKFPQHSTVKDNLVRMQEICKIYHTLDISASDLLGYGYVGAERKQFYLFDYLAGQDFKSYSQTHCSLLEIHQAGVEIGQDLQRLKLYPLAQLKHIEHEDIAKLTQHGQNLYRKLQKDLQALQPTLLPLLEVFLQGPKIFAYTQLALIHGDIKRSNIIISPAGKKSFIDIGAMKVSYDVLNFRYQIAWLLLPENRQKRAFAHGFFDGLYNFTRPENFREQVIYVTVLNFLEHTYKFAHDRQEISWYFAKMRPVFERLTDSSGTII